MASTTCAMHFDPGPFSSIDCQRLPRCHLSISFWVFLLVVFHLWVSTLMLFSPTWCSSFWLHVLHLSILKNARWGPFVYASHLVAYYVIQRGIVSVFNFLQNFKYFFFSFNGFFYTTTNAVKLNKSQDN